MFTFRSFVKLQNSLFCIWHYITKSNHYTTKVECSSSELEKEFLHHIKNECGYKVSSITDNCQDYSKSFIAENPKLTVIHFLVKSLPSKFVFQISESQNNSSLIKFQFMISRRIWYLLSFFAFFLLIAISYLSFQTDSIRNTPSYHCMFKELLYLALVALSLVLFVRIAYIVIVYRKFAKELLAKITSKLSDRPYFKELEFREYPIKPYVDIWLIIFYGILLLFIVQENFNIEFSALALTYFLFAFVIIVLLVIVAAKSLQGSLLHTKIVAIGFNITVTVILLFLFLFAPIAISCGLEKINHADEKFINIYGATANEIYSNMNRYPNFSKTNFTSEARFTIYRFIALQMFAIVVVLYVIKLFMFNLHNIYNEHGLDMKRRFNQFTSTCKQKKPNLKVPWPLRLFVWTTYFMLSGAMWFSLYVNGSIIFSLLWPDCPKLHFGYGEKIVIGMNKVLLIADFNVFNRPIYILLVFSPLLILYVLFIGNNIYYFFSDFQKHLRMPHVKESKVQEVANTIAALMGVKNVYCVKDKEGQFYSPRAIILAKKNLIIFSEKALDVYGDNEIFLKSVIAHEIVHLKKDCRYFRRYEILSRLGMVGVGFLSVLYDSPSIENRAHEEAIKYLKGKVNQAEYQTVEISINAFEKYNIKSQKSISNFLYLLNPWLILKDYYFERKVYDYIHMKSVEPNV